MTDTLKPCPIDEGHGLVMTSKPSPCYDCLVYCGLCFISAPLSVWQSLPRNEKPKPNGPRTKLELTKEFGHPPNTTLRDMDEAITAAREDIAAMLRNGVDRLGQTARTNGLLLELADEIERMP